MDMKIMNFLDVYNVTIAAIATIFAGILGPHWYIFGAFLLLNVFDFLTGWYKSRKLHTESSSAGLNGIIKKVFYWIIIVVAFLIAYIFMALGNEILGKDLDFLALIGWFTVACLIINEIRSVFENLAECGVEVPEVLIKGLAVTEKLIKNQADEQIPDENTEKTKTEE